MRIEECRIAGNELCLKVKDLVNAKRWAYYFKCGDYDIVKHKEKRSLNANALCWKLCTQIADVLRTDKDSVYVDMLKKYGQSDVISVLSTVNVKGYFKYYDVFGNGYVKDKKFTHYKVYKGSSEYDSKEMSILIDGIIEEAKALDIDVISERERSLLLASWGNEKNSKVVVAIGDLNEEGGVENGGYKS